MAFLHETSLNASLNASCVSLVLVLLDRLDVSVFSTAIRLDRICNT